VDGNSPRTLANGDPEVQAVLVPAAACEIIDTWHTAGLRGTGSHDFRVEDVFVPIEHSVPLTAFFSGPSVRPSTGYCTPFYDLASPMTAAVGLGIARAAIETFLLLARGKTQVLGRTTVGDQHTVHQRVGQAEALLRAARAYLYTTVQEVTASHHAGTPTCDEDAAALRLATSYCGQSAVDVVDLMFDAAGGTAIYEGCRLERCFRDVHMVTHHMMAAPSTIEMVGQFLLGGPLTPRR
jgi:alkylation response protein AidB-like acyl-CoA dehydrogenase